MRIGPTKPNAVMPGKVGVTRPMPRPTVGGGSSAGSLGGYAPPGTGGGMRIPMGGMKRGGMASTASSASKRADGIAKKGKTKGRMC